MLLYWRKLFGKAWWLPNLLLVCQRGNKVEESGSMTDWNVEMVGAGTALGTDIPSLSYCQSAFFIFTCIYFSSKCALL